MSTLVRFLSLIGLLSLALMACVTIGDSHPCRTSEDCTSPLICLQNWCVPAYMREKLRGERRTQERSEPDAGIGPDCKIACQLGETKPCFPAAEKGCVEKDGKLICQQPCKPGVSYCRFDQSRCPSWSACASAVVAKPETCDNKDEDCDGKVDNGLTRACGAAVGVCKTGQERCVAGKWEGCDATKPTAELCDRRDNDCDGQVDEDFLQQKLYQSCEVGVGACKVEGVWICAKDAKRAVCSVAPKKPGVERCDGVDNNCDGKPDNLISPVLMSSKSSVTSITYVGQAVYDNLGNYFVAIEFQGSLEFLGTSLQSKGNEKEFVIFRVSSKNTVDWSVYLRGYKLLFRPFLVPDQKGGVYFAASAVQWIKDNSSGWIGSHQSQANRVGPGKGVSFLAFIKSSGLVGKDVWSPTPTPQTTKDTFFIQSVAFGAGTTPVAIVNARSDFMMLNWSTSSSTAGRFQEQGFQASFITFSGDLSKMEKSQTPQGVFGDFEVFWIFSLKNGQIFFNCELTGEVLVNSKSAKSSNGGTGNSKCWGTIDIKSLKLLSLSLEEGRSDAGGPVSYSPSWVSAGNEDKLYMGSFLTGKWQFPGGLKADVGLNGNTSVLFLARFDLTKKAFDWVATADKYEAGKESQVTGVALDAQGRLVVSGDFEGSITLGPSVLTTKKKTAFVAFVNAETGKFTKAFAVENPDKPKANVSEVQAHALSYDPKLGLMRMLFSFGESVTIGGETIKHPADRSDGYGILSFDPVHGLACPK